ncbi:hypothetical protein PR048_033453 [Dryococelus australis]|uniref:Uncharacterized protein n=1 Tax=Dryococelus australis TaxID=614101 RepID=A0ABQ9G0B3_9NEOP|nr:hypothetical protein PR048_033453 [Dryococelus australis]
MSLFQSTPCFQSSLEFALSTRPFKSARLLNTGGFHSPALGGPTKTSIIASTPLFILLRVLSSSLPRDQASAPPILAIGAPSTIKTLFSASSGKRRPITAGRRPRRLIPGHPATRTTHALDALVPPPSNTIENKVFMPYLGDQSTDLHQILHTRSGTVGYANRLACSPPTKTILVQSPAGSLRIFASGNRPDRYRWSAGFLGDLPFSLSLPFRRCYILISSTLIGSQDLAVKSRANLFTHSVLLWCALRSRPLDQDAGINVTKTSRFCRRTRRPKLFTKVVTDCAALERRIAETSVRCTLLRQASMLLHPLVHVVCDTPWRTLAQSSSSTVTADNQCSVNIGSLAESSLQVIEHRPEKFASSMTCRIDSTVLFTIMPISTAHRLPAVAVEGDDWGQRSAGGVKHLRNIVGLQASSGHDSHELESGSGPRRESNPVSQGGRRVVYPPDHRGPTCDYLISPESLAPLRLPSNRFGGSSPLQYMMVDGIYRKGGRGDGRPINPRDRQLLTLPYFADVPRKRRVWNQRPGFAARVDDKIRAPEFSHKCSTPMCGARGKRATITPRNYLSYRFTIDLQDIYCNHKGEGSSLGELPRDPENYLQSQVLLATSNSRGDVVVRLLTSHLGDPASIPGGFALGFSHVGIAPDNVAGWRVFSGLSDFPRPCILALLHTHLTSPSSVLETSMLRAARNYPFRIIFFFKEIDGKNQPFIPPHSFPRDAQTYFTASETRRGDVTRKLSTPSTAAHDGLAELQELPLRTKYTDRCRLDVTTLAPAKCVICFDHGRYDTQTRTTGDMLLTQRLVVHAVIIVVLNSVVTKVRAVPTAMRAVLTAVNAVLCKVHVVQTAVHAVLTAERAMLTPVSALLTAVRTVLTEIHAVLTTVHAVLTAVRAVLTVVHAVLTAVRAMLTQVSALLNCSACSAH